MSGTDAVKKLQQKFEKLGSPPAGADTLGNLERIENVVEAKVRMPTVQLNVRVPPKTKKRIRLLAARDGKSLSDVIVLGVALYEEKYGAAPEI